MGEALELEGDEAIEAIDEYEFNDEYFQRQVSRSLLIGIGFCRIGLTK